MAHALRKFELKEGKGWLPVEGVIPDMTADTKSYIALQQVYLFILLLILIHKVYSNRYIIFL